MATPNPYDEGEDDHQLWQWLTSGGTSNAQDTAPLVRTSASVNTAGTLTPSDDVTVDGTSGGVTVLAANTNRKAAFIQNVGTANMRVGTGTLTASHGLQLVPGATLVLESPFCPTAAIKAIRESSTSTTVAVSEIA